MTSAPRLREAFDPRANGLNLFRLILAASVIVTHSFTLTGNKVGWEPARVLLSQAGVDGFFAVSGFLIAASWVRRPRAIDFLRARVLRILPGLWVCLLVTAVAIAPLAVALSGSNLPSGYSGGATNYVLHNFLLQDQQQDIAGTPSGVPYPHAWNSSLWTLRWEFLCYLAILALGLLGWLTRRWMIVLAFIAFTFAQLVVTLVGIDSYWITSPVRFALMFLAGTLIYSLQHRLPVSRALVAASAVAVAVAAAALPEYRILAAGPFAYALIAGSTFVRSERLQLRNDISYGTYIYGFPVQQLLASTAIVTWAPPAFAVVALICVMPLATGSWYLVEKPSQRLRRRPAHDATPAATDAVLVPRN